MIFVLNYKMCLLLISAEPSLDMPGKLKVQGVEEEGSATMEEGDGFNLNELIGTDSLSKGVFGFRGKRQSPSSGTLTSFHNSPFTYFRN